MHKNAFFECAGVWNLPLLSPYCPEMNSSCTTQGCNGGKQVVRLLFLDASQTSQTHFQVSSCLFLYTGMEMSFNFNKL